MEVKENNIMDVDSKISFLAGYIFTAITSISLIGILQAALVGFIGGFFGLLGKEIFYLVKDYMKDYKND